jgi:hypothetical protein
MNFEQLIVSKLVGTGKSFYIPVPVQKGEVMKCEHGSGTGARQINKKCGNQNN